MIAYAPPRDQVSDVTRTESNGCRRDADRDKLGAGIRTGGHAQQSLEAIEDEEVGGGDGPQVPRHESAAPRAIVSRANASVAA